MNPHAPQHTFFSISATAQNLFTDNAYVYGMIMSSTGVSVITLRTRSDQNTDPELAASWDVDLAIFVSNAGGETHWKFAYPVLVDKGLRINTTALALVTLFHSHIAT